MLSDIIIGAVEGGTGYWAEAANYQWSSEDAWPASVTLIEMTEDEADQDGKRIVLDAVSVANAMFRIAHDAELNVAQRFRQEVAVALATNDAGDCDADTSDVIAQVAAFGEVRYG